MDFSLFSLVSALNPETINPRPDLIHGWRFDKTINLPFVIGVVGLVAAGSVWVGHIDERMAKVEEVVGDVAVQNRMVDRLDVRVSTVEDQIRELKDPHYNDIRRE
jgi:hypothetical protein